jgi:prolyl oligopeptidase
MSPRGDAVDSLHSEPVPDPYRWLENATSDKVQAWTRAQDQLARAYLIDLPAREHIEDRLEEIEYHDAVSAPIRRSERYFYTRRHADKEAEILYWKQDEDGKEIVLFDSNEPGAGALVGFWPSPDGRKVVCALETAIGVTLEVMDVDKGKPSTIDRIAEVAHAEPSWTADSKSFYYTKLPTDQNIPRADRIGHAHVRHHVLGHAPKHDVLVYPAIKDPGKRVRAEVSADGSYLILTISHGWIASDVYIKELQPAVSKKPASGRSRKTAQPDGTHGFKPLVTGIPALFQVQAWNGSLYVRTNHEAPNYRLFQVDPRALSMNTWREIVAESRSVLHDVHIAGDHLVLTYLQNAHSQLEVRSLDGRKIRRVTLPGQGSVAHMIARADQAEAYFTYSSFTEPPQILRLSVKSGRTTPWAAITVPIDTGRMVVDQVWYPSRDGTKVSMFIIRPARAKRGSKHPAVLHGEGAFGRAMTPWFSARIAVWVERGGIYAIPNLRGGGEYGADWHKAGTRLDKQNTIDDFLHAADYLIDAGWTTPERLAITGGPHSGPLIGAAMIQEPRLFEAAVCAQPTLDMIRYHLSGKGKTWIPEYGSAENAGEFAALRAYSPYHRLRRDTRYPALLVFGADSGDIDPMHARKFVAAMQWAQTSNAPALLHMERAGQSADPVRRRVEQDAAELAFLATALR